MYIGHINLDPSLDGAAARLIGLLEDLQQHGARQYVVVRSTVLAKRLDLLEDVAVGPVVRSSVTAACLMPNVDVVHVHSASARQAGLILKLTRSIPFVLTASQVDAQTRNPIVQSIYKRASGLIAEGEIDVAEHWQVYRRALESLRVPTLLL